MNKSKLLAFFILIVSTAIVFAQAGSNTPASGTEVPRSILNNPYYLESVRLTEMAKEAYETGDYDASTEYARQASENARRSDAYVARRLAENVFLRAHSRYIWAGSVGAATRYPDAYQTATGAYTEAQDARTVEDWENVTDASNRVLAALADVKGAGGQQAPPSITPAGGLPAQYTVRDWKATGDCFWNIAGRLGVYGDNYQWRKLYEANKEKLPDPKNPNWVEPGTVLDIPSLKGETRSGMWDPSAKY
jgi:nucleoid-associated protein YgaU